MNVIKRCSPTVNSNQINKTMYSFINNVVKVIATTIVVEGIKEASKQIHKSDVVRKVSNTVQEVMEQATKANLTKYM